MLPACTVEMLLAVEGGGFFSSSASGYSHGLALLFLGRRNEEKTIRASPWNRYRLVGREVESEYQLASRKNQVTGKCAPFICFGCAPARLDGPSPPKVGPANQSEKLSKLPCCVKGMIPINDKKGCMKSNLKLDSSERCLIANEGQDARESLDERQNINACVERRKVQWTDTCGKELVDVREFEVSDTGISDDESEPAGFKRCVCVMSSTQRNSAFMARGATETGLDNCWPSYRGTIS